MNTDPESSATTSAPHEPAAGPLTDAASTPVAEGLPAAESTNPKGPNKALLVAVAFGLALLLGAAALLFGLNKL